MPAAYAEVVRKIHINKEAGRSNDPLLVFKQFFSTFKPIWRNMERKSLNGHATVVGGHATVDRLSNNDSSTFHAIRKISEKSRWMVTRQWLEVTQPSADWQTTSLGRFKQLGKILKKSRWTFTRQWSEVTRPSADCQTTFFDVSSDIEKFRKKSLNGHATEVGCQATVGRLSNNVSWTFQVIRKNYEKNLWTVTWQWSEVTRLSADCQATFFRRFKQLGKFFKKVAERSRDSDRRSRDRRPTVKQRFLYVSNN